MSKTRIRVWLAVLLLAVAAGYLLYYLSIPKGMPQKEGTLVKGCPEIECAYMPLVRAREDIYYE